MTYLQNKFENEKQKLLELSHKKKTARQREVELINKETEIIETARIKFGIDFESPE